MKPEIAVPSICAWATMLGGMTLFAAAVAVITECPSYFVYTLRLAEMMLGSACFVIGLGGLLAFNDP